MARNGSGAETKEAIRLAATAEFRKRGYQAATLEDIADRLGITRPAILNHFGSKAELLRAVVNPYLAALSDALAKHEPSVRGAPRRRRLLMTDIADAIGAHAQVAGVLLRDITCHADDHIGQLCSQLAERFLILLAGPDPTSHDRIIATATLGAIAWPLTQRSIDLNDPDARRLIVDVAVTISRPIDRESHPTPISVAAG